MLVHVPSVTIWGTKIGINNMQSIRLFKPQLNKKFKEVRWFANPSLQVGGRDRGRARHEGGKIVPYTYIYNMGQGKTEGGMLHSYPRDESHPIYAVLRLCSTFVTPYIIVVSP